MYVPDFEVALSGKNPELPDRWEVLAIAVGDRDWEPFQAFTREGLNELDANGLPSYAHFEDSYVGEWNTFEEYSLNVAEDLFGVGSTLPVEYFNLTQFAESLSFDHTVIKNGCTVYVFATPRQEVEVSDFYARLDFNGGHVYTVAELSESITATTPDGAEIEFESISKEESSHGMSEFRVGRFYDHVLTDLDNFSCGLDEVLKITYRMIEAEMDLMLAAADLKWEAGRVRLRLSD